MDDEKFIYRVGKLSLGPRDVVVLKCEVVLSKEQADRLHDQAKAKLETAGIDNPVVIVAAGLELQIIERTPEVEDA